MIPPTFLSPFINEEARAHTSVEHAVLIAHLMTQLRLVLTYPDVQTIREKVRAALDKAEELSE